MSTLALITTARLRARATVQAKTITR
jgi:hypothetical protein